MTSNSQNAPTETLLRLVADPRRRMVLNYLHEHSNDAVTLEDLTELLVAECTPATLGRSPAESRVRTALVHRHLPKLDDAGLIEYDTDSRTVEYCGDDHVTDLLEFISTHIE